MMNKKEKLKNIIEYVRVNSIATYAEIANLIDVSESTARNYVIELEKMNEISIVRGGVINKNDDITRQIMNVRSSVNQEEKMELVNTIGKYVKDGQTIALNGGTTAAEAAKYLANNYDHLTIITNNITALNILRSKLNFKCIVCGGIYNVKENTTNARTYTEIMESFNADYALIGANSISIEKGITDFRVEEKSVINAMIDMAGKTIIMADHEKFDRVASYNIRKMENEMIIITDSGIDDNIVEKYRKEGITIIKGNKNASGREI